MEAKELTAKQEDFLLEESRELAADLKRKELSNCCGADFVEESDVCSKCNEHCKIINI